MAENSVYTRTVSEEEAAEEYFMILKDQLSFFPMVGSQFTLQIGSRGVTSSVEKYHCECRGPDKPHDHYFIRQKGLQKGDIVVLRKDGKKPGRYIMSVRSSAARKELCG